MNSDESLPFRAAFAIAAVALSLTTMVLTVGVPARIDAGTTTMHLAQAASPHVE